MLIDVADQTEQKRVAVAVQEPGFGQLLRAVLALWGYGVVEDPAEAGLLLAGPGESVPAGVTLVRLGGAAGSGRLELPLQLEELWALLEQRFHQPQRQRIRIALQLEVGLVARHRYSDARLESLSDMGGRLIYPRELVRGEGLLLRLPVEGRVFELSGRVIYSFPRGDGAEYESGVVFEGVGVEVRRLLRRFIVQQMLELALLRAGAGAEAGLRCFRQD